MPAPRKNRDRTLRLTDVRVKCSPEEKRIVEEYHRRLHLEGIGPSLRLLPFDVLVRDAKRLDAKWPKPGPLYAQRAAKLAGQEGQRLANLALTILTLK